MKFLLTGLTTEATKSSVWSGMEKLGPVTSIEMVKQNNGDQWAIVEMPVTDDQAFKITQRITDVWHAGKFVNISILNH